MNIRKSKISLWALLAMAVISTFSCEKTVTVTTTSEYKGTGSVSQGVGKTTTPNLFPAGMRVAALGTISSTDGKTWTVPADVNFTNTSFPTASDLNHSRLNRLSLIRAQYKMSEPSMYCW